jgi:crooked neck
VLPVYVSVYRPTLFCYTTYTLQVTHCKKEWIQYASWEASQNEFACARSVFKHAVDPQSGPLWLTYTETKLKSHNVQHVRNLFNCAITLLPCVDQL